MIKYMDKLWRRALHFGHYILDYQDGDRAPTMQRDDNDQFEILSRFLPAGIFFTDTQGHCSYVNKAWLDMSGLTEVEALASGWASAIHPEDRDAVFDDWTSTVKERELFDLEFRFQKPNGSTVWLHTLSCPYRDKNGNILGYVGACFNISKRKGLEQQLDRTNRQFRQAETIANIGSWRIDVETLQLDWSDQIFDIHGLEPPNAPPLREILKHYSGDASRQLFQAITAAVETTSAFDIETDFITAQGEVRRLRNMGQTELVEGKPASVFGICQDVTDRHHLEKRLRSAANTDELTKIPNRAVYNEALRDMTRGEDTSSENFTLFLIDLNEFKWINDTLGHPGGDELLVTVAERLSNLEQISLVARLGGDEFAVLRKEPTAGYAVIDFSTKLTDCFASPFKIGAQEVKVGASIGAAHWPFHGETIKSLTRNADFALYQAKEKQDGKISYFDEELGAQIARKQKLNKDLRGALLNNEFILHFQPQYCLKEKRVDGFEALLRWNNPASGLVPPTEFIPALEETGLIIQVGEWVLREACRIAATWPEDVRLAVNVSPVQLQQDNFQNIVVQALARHNFAADRLELEVTENILMDDVEAARSKLKSLRSLGVRLALDDFGSGFSSLSYLHSFSFDSVKIDRSFVSELGENSDSRAIVQSITRLAKALRIETVAEGVELPGQLEFLERQGCDKIQGYLFSKPVPEDEVLRLIEKLSNHGGQQRVA